jgi:hypothetical protein
MRESNTKASIKLATGEGQSMSEHCMEPCPSKPVLGFFLFEYMRAHTHEYAWEIHARTLARVTHARGAREYMRAHTQE